MAGWTSITPLGQRTSLSTSRAGIARPSRRLAFVAGLVAVLGAVVGGSALFRSINTQADSGFAPTTNYPVTQTRPTAGWAGDLSGSGYPDFAFTDADGSRVGVINQMTWPWDNSATYYPVGTDPRSIAAGDFYGDGHRDLATANNGANSVSVLLNGWNQGWGKAFHAAVNYAVGTDPVFVVAGDTYAVNPTYRTVVATAIAFNKDGKRDIATVNRGSNSVSILLGNGDGTFQPAHSYAAGTDPLAAAALDVNGDGVDDLVVADDSADSY